jgi:hypothetical protein
LRLRGLDLLIGEGFLTRVQISLALRESVLLLGLMFVGQTLLDLAVDLGFFFFFGLLLLAGDKNGQGKACAKNTKLLHRGLRLLSSEVIRTKQPNGRYFGGAEGDGEEAVAGVNVTVSILSRRKRCTFA